VAETKAVLSDTRTR